MKHHSAEPEPSAAIDAALSEYLNLRGRDMDLWRRAGLAAQLTHSSMLALVAILRADLDGAPLRQVDLQRTLRISPAGTSTIVTELEGRDLVRREAAPSDRRAVQLVTGPAGAPIAAQIMTYDDEIRALLAELPTDTLGPVLQLFVGMRGIVESKYVPQPDGSISWTDRVSVEWVDPEHIVSVRPVVIRAGERAAVLAEVKRVGMPTERFVVDRDCATEDLDRIWSAFITDIEAGGAAR